MMNIAILVNELNVRGGTHKQVLRLCEYLKRQGVQFTVFTKIYESNKTYPEFSKLPVKTLADLGIVFPGKRGKIGRMLDEISVECRLARLLAHEYDIINVHDNGFPWVMRFAKNLNYKVFWQINDMPVCFLSGNATGRRDSLAFKLKRAMYRKLASSVDQITVNVTKNKELVQKLLGKDAKVLYCGVDSNSSLNMHAYPAQGKTIHLLSTGVFFKYRNYETLVKTVHQLRGRGTDIVLDIIGDTSWSKPYVDAVEAQVKALDAGAYVNIWGRVDEAKYAELYNDADIFAFVNINQSWGLAVFEAMSCGIPVIVSNSVGAIELLHDGVDSAIVDPEDVDEICAVIERLIRDSAYYQKLSVNGSKSVSSYTWDRMYSGRLLELFKEALGQ